MHACARVQALCLSECVHACLFIRVCAGGGTEGVSPPARPHPAHWVSPQGVILCFGLCARGQVKTVLGVLHDFEERIQESEQSWQIGAWRVRHPCSIVSFLGALRMVFSAPNQDSSVQFSSVSQSCPTLCNPMNRSMPGLHVHHQLLGPTQTHVH